MGRFRYAFNDDEYPLQTEFEKITPSLRKLLQQGKKNELLAAFVVSLFGFREIYSNMSPAGERKHRYSVRKKAMEGLEGNMFDSAVNWLTCAYISHLESTDLRTIQALTRLRDEIFAPAFKLFASGELTPHLPPEMQSLTKQKRLSALHALGSWAPR